MKVTIFNGAICCDKVLYSMHEIIVGELAAKGWDVFSLTPRDMNITHCLGCFECWDKTPGRCRFKDDGVQIAKAYINSDLVVLFTPVTFGGYSSELKKALDRIICLLSPFFMRINGEVHHKKRYERYLDIYEVMSWITSASLRFPSATVVNDRQGLPGNAELYSAAGSYQCRVQLGVPRGQPLKGLGHLPCR